MSKNMAELYDSPELERKEYIETDQNEAKLIAELENRTDTEASRIKRYMAMDDLSRKAGSPIKEMIDRVLSLDIFKKFDVIKIPEIVPKTQTFDLFDFPLDHPARSKSDTYYINEDYILRTHTTVMWYYYFNLPEIKEKIKEEKDMAVISYGKVFRKDEIDRRHMNIFHQVDGLYICKNEERIITQDDLKEVLVAVAQTVFGKDIKYRFNPDKFPYTHDSLEMEVDKDGQWVEVLGAGVVQPSVLEKLGVSSKTYNGWAFGFGLERLAIISMELPDIRLLWSEDPRVIKQLKLGNKFVEVSKYPEVKRDISFIVASDFIPNNYFDLIRDIGGDLVEEVELLDKYENEEKFGKDKVSYAYRVVYRSNDRTLKSSEVDLIHKKLEEETKKLFNATIR
jgi:phenylalanyl-tRNA synthetase alpha chain